MQYGVIKRNRIWRPHDGAWEYWVLPRFSNCPTHLLAVVENGQAMEPSGRILATGGTDEGLRAFVERVSQNWRV